MARGRDKIAQLPRECCELGDAVGADPVDAELPQCFPFVWIVGGPRDDSRTRGVRSSDQVLVDKRNFLPEILRARCGERGDWIDLTGAFEHPRPNRREKTLHVFYDAMIEGVDRAVYSGVADAANDERLDCGCLDFDVDPRAFSNRCKHCVERWNLDAVSQGKAPQVRR